MKKILIIEDDQIVANIYRNKLSVDGFKVEAVYDGEAGLVAMKEFRPDVVLLDLMLPKITGLEVMKQVRAEPDFSATPIIVFSNTYLTNMVQEAWKAGATKCLSKANCTPKHVIDAVCSALGIAAPGSPSVARQPAPPVHKPVQKPAAPVQRQAAPAPSDAEFQDGLRREFVASLPATLTAMRGLLQGLFKAGDEAARIKHLQDLYRRVHATTGNAAVAGLPLIAQMADALEVLLKELYEKPKSINASTLRTVASAVDFLGVLFERGTAPGVQEIPPAQILVVDDEAISRRAVTYALEKAKLKSVNVEDPLVAFQMLAERRFDLIFLDVDMPNMNGFELCSKLRALPAYKTTPVVFVTSLTDFESRANSTMSGGNDFIAKPFLFIELAVKALVYVLRPKIGAQK
jgi:DNA-binding response OmpR family regulator/HPt (histidine-containing phosphotransfer) domain-containing protein